MTLHSPTRWTLLLALAGLGACEAEVVQPVRSTPLEAAKSASSLAGSVGYRAAGPSAQKSFSAALAEEIPPSEIRLAETVFSTDFVSAGLGGMRNAGSGTLTLAGISGTVNRAVMYWHGPTNTTALDANADVVVNGVAVSGTNIGLASDNCWGYENSMAYVADVTSIVQATRNGGYALTGFASANDLPGEANTNGASIIVFFQDGNGANNRDVALFHGNDSNVDSPYDPEGWDFTLAGINYPGGAANLQFHVADGQSFADDALRVNGSVIDPAGPVFNGTTVPQGDGPNLNGLLWDRKSYDISSLLSPGLNDVRVTTGTLGDCIAAVAVLIDLPAGAAPTPDFAFQPAIWSLTRTGTITVYLLTDPSFDAADAEASEARMVVDNTGVGAPVAQRNGSYMTALRDFDGDGDQDRMLVFTMSDLRAAGLTTATSSLTLVDRTGPFQYNGRPIRFPTITP